MRFFTTDKLRAGMRLARPIYDKRGVLLYDRNSVLTGQVLENIKNFNLIGVFILEEAEPVPPITDEEREFEQLQTSYMFRLRDCLVAISKGRMLPDFKTLVSDITAKYSHKTGSFHFSQLIRSTDDYTYKHSVCTAILCALIGKQLSMSEKTISDLVTAALLADFGYLYVPKNIMLKDEAQWTAVDILTVEQYRRKAYELLKPADNPYGFSFNALELTEKALEISRAEPPQINTSDWSTEAKILLVADKYDRMTAMSLSKQPQSALSAYKYLKKKYVIYEPMVVSGLAKAISIMPPGQSVRLNTHNTALVLEEGGADADRPVLLDLKSNSLIDLGDSLTKGILEIDDIMESLDTRYKCDEETLKQFVPDEQLKEVTRRIRIRLANAKKRAENRQRR